MKGNATQITHSNIHELSIEQQEILLAMENLKLQEYHDDNKEFFNNQNFK